jgi:hypothetical protein
LEEVRNFVSIFYELQGLLLLVFIIIIIIVVVVGRPGSSPGRVRCFSLRTRVQPEFGAHPVRTGGKATEL